MKKVIFIIASILIVGLLAWTMYYLYEKSQEKPVSFKVEAAKRTDII